MPEIAGRYWLMTATLGFIWGATFMVIELALEGITPFWLTAGRIGFAALLLWGIWGARGFPLFKEQTNWPVLLLLGLLNTLVPFSLISWGQQYVTSGFTGVTMAGIGLMVLPLAHVFIPGEQMSLRRLAGFLIGFAGVALLFGGQAFDSTGDAMEPLGRLACLAAVACYAVSSILTRRLPPVDPVGLAAIPLAIGTLLILPAAWMVEGSPPSVDLQTLGYLAILGLFPTAGAAFLRVLVIRGAGPTFMSLTSYQVPVWSVVLGAVFLNEPLPASLLVALALILSGMGLSQYGALRRLFGRGQ